LIWIINLVKWHAGHNKYQFNEGTLGGHRVVNDQLDLETQTQEEVEGEQTDQDKQDSQRFALANIS